MASYPSSIYSPRTKSNKYGVVYDESKQTIIFADDIVNLDNEVVAIEETLGENVQGGYDNVADFLTAIVAALALKLENVEEDLSPSLGGDLESNGFDIKMATNDKILFDIDVEIFADEYNDLIIRQLTEDKDIKIFVNKGGSDTQIMKFIGAEGDVLISEDSETTPHIKLQPNISGVVALTLTSEGGVSRVVLAPHGSFANLTARRRNGTIASPTAVNDNDILIRFGGGGYDGVSLSGNQAQVDFVAVGNWSPTSRGAKLNLDVTPSGTTTRITGLSISDTGDVYIPNGNLHLSGNNKELRFYEGANYVGFEAPALTANQIWVLPSEDGSLNDILVTDGAGNLSFQTLGGEAGRTDGCILRWEESETAWKVTCAITIDDFQNVFIGGESDKIEISNYGDINFVGGAGLQLGEIYYNNGGSDIVLSSQDTWYKITTFNTNGVNNGDVTPDHTNNHISVTDSGIYRIAYSVSSRANTSNKYVFAVRINNGSSTFNNSFTQNHTPLADKIFTASTSALCDIPAGATIELWVKRTDGGAVSKTLTIEQVVLNVSQIAG